jgi:hypothetical protein
MYYDESSEFVIDILLNRKKLMETGIMDEIDIKYRPHKSPKLKLKG